MYSPHLKKHHKVIDSTELKQRQEKHAEPTVENILEKLGGYSWFQLWATFILVSPEIPAAMLALSPLLVGASDSPKNCSLEAQMFNSTSDICMNQICTGTSTSQNDIFKFYTITQEWNLYCNRAWITDTLTSVQLIGSTVGALFCSFLADKYGRKKMFYGLALTMGFFGFVSGCAIDVISYGIARFFVGIAVGGMYVVYLNYLVEFLTPSFRTICGCVSFWAVGEMLLALLGYLLPEWRILTWAISLPALIILISFPWFPESPRFLLCLGRTEEAITIFNTIAYWNKKEEVDALEVHKLQMSITKKMQDAEGQGFGATQILKSPIYCKQFTIFMWAWFTSSIIYYGLSFNTKNLSGNLYLNVFYLGVSDLPGYFSGILFNNRFGRKKTLMGFLLFGTTFFISLAIIAQVKISAPTLVVVLSLFGRYCTSASWAIIACFTSESFPTVGRATCMGFCAFAGNIGSVISPQVVSLGTLWTAGPYIVMSVLSLITVMASTGLNEIVRKPLQDSISSSAA